jgi:hypothetical protein
MTALSPHDWKTYQHMRILAKRQVWVRCGSLTSSLINFGARCRHFIPFEKPLKIRDNL